MEERFKKLDDFLRKQLKDASEDRTWNVPDDAIFEKAMRTVADQKKTKRRGWILIPILLGAGLIVNEFYHYRQIENLQGKITTLEKNLAKEPIAADALASTSSNLQELKSSPQEMTSIDKQEKNSIASASETSPNAELTPNPNSIVSTPSNPSSTLSTSNTQTLDATSPKPKSLVPQTKDGSTVLTATISNAEQAKSNQLSNKSASITSVGNDVTESRMNNALIANKSETEEIRNASMPGMTLAGSRTTMQLSSLDLNDLEIETTLPEIPSIAANTNNSLQKTTLPVFPLQYGLLLGANQSRLTMTNVPPGGSVSLHDYDNNQPGFSMHGFVNKPISHKFSVETGLGYDVYHNRSIMEDQFLLDPNNIVLMPNGQAMYQTDYNLMNPIGAYNMLLEFRVSDPMQQNDTIVEYSENEQTIQSVMLDLGVRYDLLSLPHVKVSLGTGFGLGYIAGLKNEFNVSTYYNGIFQESQMETPDQLDDITRWYGQWLGNLSVGYYPTERLGFILNGQYNAGLTSIRDGGTDNGPLTFLHSFTLSAGISSSF